MSIWMREVYIPELDNRAGIRTSMKLLAYFLRYCCGFTNCTESVSVGGQHFWSHEKTGAGTGSFSGTDFVFSATGAPFASTDRDKWLVVQDSTNRRNAGVYRIKGYTDSGNIIIDFRSAPNEYPTASTGLSWWILGSSFELPSTQGDYFRCQSPHSTGWAVQMTYINWYGGMGGVCINRITVAVDGNWAGGKILSYVDYGFAAYTNHDLFWGAEVDEAGEYANLFCYSMASNGADTNYFSGAIISRVTPLDIGHSDAELLALCGATDPYAAGGRFYRNYDANMLGHCRVWSDLNNAQINAYMTEYTYAGHAAGFTGWTLQDPNQRLGGLNEVMSGTPIICDPDNSANAYQFYGWLKGHWTARGSFPIKTLMSTNGTLKDRYHIMDGIVIAWPNLSPQI